MIRLLMFLLGRNDYEPCKGCETYKAQLEISNIEKRELYETLLKLVKPEVIHTASPTLVNPVEQFTTFSKRRAHLENSLKVAKETRERSPFLAKVDDKSDVQPTTAVTSETINEMETKLGLAEVQEVSNG